MDYFERSVEGKKILWFKESNRYLLAEEPAYQIMSRLNNGSSQGAVALWCSDFYHLPETEAQRFVNEIVQSIEQLTDSHKTDTEIPSLQLHATSPEMVFSRKVYSLFGASYAVDFETKYAEQLIHPKFAHLEDNSKQTADHHFKVSHNQERFALVIDGVNIGQWTSDDAHYLSGKFSMELLNRMYVRGDADWLGVFHASAISRDNQCLLFLGKSGSGKSTTCAVLMAAGFNLVADDFVPVDSATREVFYFPAAVSVKKNAFDYLIPMYPELAFATEFDHPGSNKIIRYLPSSQQPENISSGYPCKGLVFVKYKKNSGLKLRKMNRDIAFQHLVPDSWISPLAENASRFLDWFLAIPCYELTYSDNQKMVSEVEKLLLN